MIEGRVFCRVSAIVLAAGLLAAGLSQAYAGDCNADIGGLSQKRQGFIDKLNQIAKASKGKLDAAASCPVLQGLVKAESELIKYLEANTSWCNIPENTVEGLKANSAKSIEFAKKACDFAEQAKKQQQQQAVGGGGLGVEAPKLPTGPL
ncbi:MAG: hypothetical protein P4L76_06175 [Beijerinckiaceae bacterium]|nr:hypothetical protein [Beijerinckiaceae bacterium]